MVTISVDNLMAMGMAARAASRELARLASPVKDEALRNVSKALIDQQKAVLEANRMDYEAARKDGLSKSMLDRLLLTPERLEEMAGDVQKVASLPDPVGEIFDARTMPNGLVVSKKRVPLGVIGTIYESRPNVTIDIVSLCVKSGNACILRGGKEAIRSNTALAELACKAIDAAGVPAQAVQFLADTNRTLLKAMLGMKGIIDLLLPRGGAELIRYVAEKAQMPVVTGGIGVCHTYVDKLAELDSASAIVFNAKVQRPTVCNAMDTLLVHSGIASQWLPLIARDWGEAGVEMKCDRRALSILAPIDGLKTSAATDDDWGTEFLSLVAAIKVVDSLDEALVHIEEYGSGHSEAIVTEDYSVAMRFLNEVDAAAVFVNASTRFADGGQFGLGTEVGISTQKFHARGPMGLKELTSYKWTILGNGQIRP